MCIKCLCIFINLSDLHLQLHLCDIDNLVVSHVLPEPSGHCLHGYGPAVTVTLGLTMLPIELLVKRGWHSIGPPIEAVMGGTQTMTDTCHCVHATDSCPL